MSTQTQEGVILSESDIKSIVASIQRANQDAKQMAKEVANDSFGVRSASFVGALSVILCRIDKRIGDAVWME